jgi:hypothetical protein
VGSLVDLRKVVRIDTDFVPRVDILRRTVSCMYTILEISTHGPVRVDVTLFGAG